jgi:hypothetical protein
VSGENKTTPVGVAPVSDQGTSRNRQVDRTAQMEKLIPKIASKLRAELEHQKVADLRRAVADERLLRKIFGMIYEGVLPPPFAGEVPRDHFLLFCMKNRDQIGQLALSPQTGSSTK